MIKNGISLFLGFMALFVVGPLAAQQVQRIDGYQVSLGFDYTVSAVTGANAGATLHPLKIDGNGDGHFICDSGCAGSGGGSGGAVTQSTGSSSSPWWFEGLGIAGTPSGGVVSIQGVAGGVFMPVSATSLPLPTGAATAANQAPPTSAGTSAGAALPVQGVTGGVSIPVSATSLPLPTGAATAANQAPPTAAGTSAGAALPVQGVTGGVALPVTSTPRTAARVAASCTVGTSSASCLAAGLAVNSLFIENLSVTATIACSPSGGTAALNAAGAIMLAPGQSMLWGPGTAGVWSTALDCIASASAPLYVEYN